jgi:hypothetical protein
VSILRAIGSFVQLRPDVNDLFRLIAGEEVGTDMQHWSRRKTLLAWSSVALLVPGSGLAATRIPTPASTEGPFYPDQLPLRTDNDLVTIVDGGQPASGEIFHLAGRVMGPAIQNRNRNLAVRRQWDISALRGFKAG